MRCRSRICSAQLAAWLVLAASGAQAEGTAQLGANQDLVEETEIQVDVVTTGEVINIAVGNDSTTDQAPVQVTVLDPDGYPLSGSPFSVGPGEEGFLDRPGEIPGTISQPLQIVTTRPGTFTVKFNNTRSDMGTSSWKQVVDPFDITVTPNKTTPVDPKSPPGGFGRVHSRRWRINAHGFTKAAASNAAFYVRVPTKWGSDHTWLLQLNGLAGHQFDVRGNDTGMPAPLSFMSVEEFLEGPSCPAGYKTDQSGRCAAIPPASQHAIYLNIPEVARGGDQAPSLEELSFSGVDDAFDCAVAGSSTTFRFTTDSHSSYNLLIDLDGDGKYEPPEELLLAGTAEPGANIIKWDGKASNGEAIKVGTYNVKLSVRTGEFHFVGQDIETANPGLRIFSVHPPKLGVTPQPAQMFWNDAQINDRALKIEPDVTPPEGISSGSFSDAPVCSAPGWAGTVNAHCWGSFTADPTTSPGDERYIDTWVYFMDSSDEIQICVGDENEFLGIGGGGGCATGAARATATTAWPLLLIVLLVPVLALRVRRLARSPGAGRR